MPVPDTVPIQSKPEAWFIKRNLKGSPQELERLAYISLVRSSMQYASSVWDPHLIKDILTHSSKFKEERRMLDY